MIVDSDDYILIYQPSHPRAIGKYVKRAILVLEQKLGRPVRDGYDSHHKNEIKDDDSPKNLEEIEHGLHRKIHVGKMKKSEIARYQK